MAISILLSQGAPDLALNHSVYMEIAAPGGSPGYTCSAQITNHFPQHLALSSVPDDHKVT